jgi:hypothetical protein
MSKEKDLRKLTDIQVLNATILPNRPHGVFQYGEQYISLNRAAQRLGGIKKLQQLLNRYFNKGGVSSMFGSRAKFSDNLSNVIAEVQAVFDRMPTLSENEKDAVATFIINEKNIGNYDLYDEFYCLSLGATNGLIGFKSKTATANGGITWGVNGATFNGTTGYIDTDWNPASDGVNYKSGDAYVSMFIKDFTQTASDRIPFGSYDGTSYDFINAYQLGRINGALFTSVENTEINYGASLDNALFSVGSSGGNTTVYLDGIFGDTDVFDGTTALNTAPFYIGARNDESSSGFFVQGTISSTLIGAEIGFDHAAHNTNLRLFLATLQVGFQVTDIDVANALLNTNITDTVEATAIQDFVIAEKAASNYVLYDEFFLLSLGSVNGLNGFKGKKATANGGITWDVNGAGFNGTTGYIDTKTAPTSKNNYMLDVFVKTSVKTSSTTLIGVSTGSNLTRINYSSGNLRVSISTSNHLQYSGSLVTHNTLVSGYRKNSSNNQGLAINDIDQGVGGRISTGAPTNDVYIGALDSSGTATQYNGSTISTALLSRTAGFDHAAHNTNIRKLLTDLGVTL